LTAFTLAANANLRDIGNAGIWGVATARTGGDTVDTNGFKLTIDQDSRYGLSGTTSTTWGNLTINASKGGDIHIDATKVWMIPFTGGSGTLTLGTQITIGGVTCNTVGIYTALTAAPATTGASGWLKVTNASGTPGTITSGTYAGFTLTANGAAIRGFIEVNGDESGTINANRLGVFRVTGEWFELGTTSGTSNQTMQCPNNGAARYLAGVFIEATAGAGDYEFWANAGTTTTTGTEAARGKVVWVDNTGLVRIGNSGAATNGHTPTAGRKVVVPNIFFENNTTAARTANVIPNATIATRYDFTCTGGGVLEIDKCNMAWYLSVSQAYSCNVSNSGFVDGISLSEVASPMTFTKVGVGNKPTTALLMSPLTIATCFAGGTFTDCVWARVSMAASGAHINTLTDMAGFTFVRDTIRANTIRGNNTTYSLNGTRLQNCVWTDPTIIQGAMVFTTCTNITVTNTKYIEVVSGTTTTTYTGTVWNATASSSNCTFSGLTMPVTNTHPYTALLAVSSAAANIKLRNIGTRVSPVTMGSANACGLIYTVASAAQDVKVQRVYVSNTRTGIMTGDNSCTRITEENVFGDYGDNADVMACLNMVRKGMGGTGALTAQTSVYGTHWRDGFTQTTAGRIAIFMNEPTASTASQVSLSGGAAFTSAGGLYMPTIGMTATFEMPEYMLGHTAFPDTAMIMGGGTAGNYEYEADCDLNNGNGWTSVTGGVRRTATVLGTMLSYLVIDASKGFKLRLKIRTQTGNTTPIQYVYFTTASTTTAQDYQYPLDVVPVTITVLDSSTLAAVQNARIRITTDVGGNIVLEGLTNASGVLTGTTQYASNAITGTVRRATVADGTLYKPNSISGTTTSAGFESTVLMTSDE
jgi:hypothetical protein